MVFLGGGGGFLGVGKTFSLHIFFVGGRFASGFCRMVGSVANGVYTPSRSCSFSIILSKLPTNTFSQYYGVCIVVDT